MNVQKIGRRSLAVALWVVFFIIGIRAFVWSDAQKIENPPFPTVETATPEQAKLIALFLNDNTPYKLFRADDGEVVFQPVKESREALFAKDREQINSLGEPTLTSAQKAEVVGLVKIKSSPDWLYWFSNKPTEVTIHEHNARIGAYQVNIFLGVIACIVVLVGGGWFWWFLLLLAGHLLSGGYYPIWYSAILFCLSAGVMRLFTLLSAWLWDDFESPQDLIDRKVQEVQGH